ncbi:MAG: hypothetical protein ABIM46_03615 [candidate division WOR-3 bacterium]
MRILKGVALGILGLIWLSGMDCGARPQDINLRYMVKDMGGSVDLMWDSAEGVIDFLLYKDDSLLDTLPPESLHYIFDSTMIGKRFRVVAEGARLEGSIDLTPYVDSFTIYEPDYSDTTPSGVSFDASGHYTLYNLHADTSSWWWGVQIIIMDTLPGAVDFSSLRLLSPSIFAMPFVTAFAVNTQDYAPTPDKDDTLFAYSYSPFVTAPEYAAWLRAGSYEWNRSCNFVRLTAVNADPAGWISIKYAYQAAGGLRWFPY